MKTAICHLVGETPYSQSKNIDALEHPKRPKETSDAYEQRMWRERIHRTKDGFVEIPGSSFANSIKEAAKRLQLQVPGKGKTQFTKYFEAGVMVTSPVVLPVKADDVRGERLFVPSDGRRGGAKRVYKTFPRIDEWEGDITVFVLDDIITVDVFKQVIVAAGQLVGIGRFRPQNAGFYGRFSVASIAWRDEEETLAAMAAE